MVLERGVHVAVLWALAVAGPLFDTLGGNPEFFAVRAASPGEIVAFALLVTFVPPLALLAAEWLVGLVSEAAAWALHVVFVAALSAAVVLGVLSLGTAPALALALVAGIAAAIVYVRFPPARTLLTVLGPAPLAFVALFLLVSDASDLVFPASADVQAVHVRSSAPVVLVIFDEFPVHSLMGPDGRIDARRYPNFARLARDATWYRNTASVDQDTPYAVPAILDGRLPRQERLPVAADHPRNVFSLLARSRLRAARERGRDRALLAGACAGTREDDAALGRRRAHRRPRAAARRGRGRARGRPRTTRRRRSPTRSWSRARPSATASSASTPTSPTTAPAASSSSSRRSRTTRARGCT